LSVIIKVNGRLCGDVISPIPTGPLSIQYQISDTDEPNAEYAIQVFRDAAGGGVAQMVMSVPAEEDGSGTIEDIAIDATPQYIFFKVIQFNESGDEDRAWTAPIWFLSQAEEVIITPPGGPNPDGANPIPSPTTDTAAASRRSNTFHVSMRCFDAQRIGSRNLVRGPEARRGRRQHPGCPRTTGPR
jgi:hypothetical protein